jgi:transaldolase
MEIFIDSLDLNKVKKYAKMGVISGVTTNPTLAKRHGMLDDIEMIQKTREALGNGKMEIHVEAFGETRNEIVDEVDRIWQKSKDDSLVFKIPFTEEGVEAVYEFKSGKVHRISGLPSIKTNMHLIFSHNQAIIASIVGSDYVCPLVGRLDDEGHEGTTYVAEMASMFRTGNIQTKIMMSSVRHPLHVIKALKAGVDVVTVPDSVLERMFYHKLTQDGIEKFKKDLEGVVKG